MGVVLENYKRQQFADGRELGREEGRELGREEGRELGHAEGRELGREEGREEVMKELMGRIITLEDQLRARSNGEAAGEDVAEPIIVKIPEPQDHDENREELIRRIAALERAVVELIASRSNGDQKN